MTERRYVGPEHFTEGLLGDYFGPRDANVLGRFEALGLNRP